MADIIVFALREISAGWIVVGLLALSSVAQDGTAGLAGRVNALTGAGISGTHVELLSETVATRKFRTLAESNGTYHFSALPPDQYTLKLSSPGFQLLTVKSIHILENEQKCLPSVQLELGSIGCDGSLGPDYLRVLPPGAHFGNLGGSIQCDRGPIARAEIMLTCGRGRVCGTTKTNADGEFMFRTVPAGKVSVRVNRAGFYPVDEPGYTIAEGLEAVYHSIYIERCPLGNCNPRLRPKKPLPVCE